MYHVFSKLFRLFINSQIKISNQFDQLIMPAKFLIDGYQDFARLVVPKYLRENSVIYDIGGGKRPYITADLKAKLKDCYVIGLDINANELKAAPSDIYDETIVADIMDYEGKMDGDLVISLALLEHVENVEVALRGVASCLKKQGQVLLFVPSKNALFARINKILPERLKRQILFTLFPHSQNTQGFPAYYDCCTPRDIKRIAQSMGFEVVDERHYYISSYFSFFFPLYLIWRFYILVFYLIAKEQAAETFGLVLKKVT